MILYGGFGYKDALQHLTLPTSHFQGFYYLPSLILRVLLGKDGLSCSLGVGVGCPECHSQAVWSVTMTGTRAVWSLCGTAVGQFSHGRGKGSGGVQAYDHVFSELLT